MINRKGLARSGNAPTALVSLDLPVQPLEPSRGLNLTTTTHGMTVRSTVGQFSLTRPLTRAVNSSISRASFSRSSTMQKRGGQA